ncbi:unnamed protein product, partial [marine sediment metagenome]
IAQLLVATAKKEGSTIVAHGCTGKGNDQVRFDVSIAALAPELKVIAPAREWNMTREQTIAYAQDHNIPVPATTASPYSVDENLWGRSIECGALEDPWSEPPTDVFAWTRFLEETPGQPSYVEIGFEKGIPLSLDDKKLDGVRLVQRIHELAGEHGKPLRSHLTTTMNHN